MSPTLNHCTQVILASALAWLLSPTPTVRNQAPTIHHSLVCPVPVHMHTSSLTTSLLANGRLCRLPSIPLTYTPHSSSSSSALLPPTPQQPNPGILVYFYAGQLVSSSVICTIAASRFLPRFANKSIFLSKCSSLLKKYSGVALQISS